MQTEGFIEEFLLPIHHTGLCFSIQFTLMRHHLVAVFFANDAVIFEVGKIRNS